MSDRRVTFWLRAMFYVAMALVILAVWAGIIVSKVGAAEWRYVRFRVTAYCPCSRCCGAHADGITASGTRADHALVAAPGRFPFGTSMRVPGYAGGRWS